MNKKQALELFEREAVCFGDHDGVPLFRARQLFGEEAAKFAVCEPHNYGLFGVGDYQCKYFYLIGFMQAATYANVEELREHEQEA